MISNLYSNRPGTNSVGLFGVLGSGGSITDVGLDNATVTGNADVGGLAGFNLGTIANCYSTGTVSGNYGIGGLVGDNWGGTITTCYASGAVSGSGSAVGGLVGWNQSGSIITCYTTAAMTGSGDSPLRPNMA